MADPNEQKALRSEIDAHFQDDYAITSSSETETTTSRRRHPTSIPSPLSPSPAETNSPLSPSLIPLPLFSSNTRNAGVLEASVENEDDDDVPPIFTERSGKRDNLIPAPLAIVKVKEKGGKAKGGRGGGSKKPNPAPAPKPPTPRPRSSDTSEEVKGEGEGGKKVLATPRHSYASGVSSISQGESATTTPKGPESVPVSPKTQPSKLPQRTQIPSVKLTTPLDEEETASTSSKEEDQEWKKPTTTLPLRPHPREGSSQPYNKSKTPEPKEFNIKPLTLKKAMKENIAATEANKNTATVSETKDEGEVKTPRLSGSETTQMPISPFSLTTPSQTSPPANVEKILNDLLFGPPLPAPTTKPSTYNDIILAYQAPLTVMMASTPPPPSDTDSSPSPSPPNTPSTPTNYDHEILEDFAWDGDFEFSPTTSPLILRPSTALSTSTTNIAGGSSVVLRGGSGEPSPEPNPTPKPEETGKQPSSSSSPSPSNVSRTSASTSSFKMNTPFKFGPMPFGATFAAPSSWGFGKGKEEGEEKSELSIEGLSDHDDDEEEEENSDPSALKFESPIPESDILPPRRPDQIPIVLAKDGSIEGGRGPNPSPDQIRRDDYARIQREMAEVARLRGLSGFRTTTSNPGPGPRPGETQNSNEEDEGKADMSDPDPFGIFGTSSAGSESSSGSSPPRSGTTTAPPPRMNMPQEITDFQATLAAQAPSLVPDEQRANQAYRNLIADLQSQILTKQNAINALKKAVGRVSHHVGEEVKAKAALKKALTEIQDLKTQLTDAENRASGSSTTPDPKQAAELEECNRAKAGLVAQVTRLTQELGDEKAAAAASPNPDPRQAAELEECNRAKVGLVAQVTKLTKLLSDAKAAAAAPDPDQVAALKKCNNDLAALKGEKAAWTKEKTALERAVQDAEEKANNGGSDGAVLDILGRALREMRDDPTKNYTPGLDVNHSALQRAQSVVDRIKEKLGAGLISQADCASRVKSATNSLQSEHDAARRDRNEKVQAAIERLQNDLDAARAALNKARADLQDCVNSKPIQKPADSIPGLDPSASTQGIIEWSGRLYASLSRQVDSQRGDLRKLGIADDQRIKECEEEKKTLNNTIEDLNKEIADLNAKFAACESREKNLGITDDQKIKECEEEKKTLNDTIEDLNKEIADLNIKLAACEAKNPTIVNTGYSSADLEDAIQLEKDKHETTIQQLEQQIEDLKKENANLRAVDLSGGSGTSPTDAATPIGEKAAKGVLQRHINKLREQVKALKEENGDLKAGVVTGAATTADYCEEQKEMLQNRIDELEARIDELTLPPDDKPTPEEIRAAITRTEAALWVMTALRSKHGLVDGDTDPATEAAINAVQMAEALGTDQNLLGRTLFWQAIAQYYDSTNQSAAQDILSQANTYSKNIADAGGDEATLLQEWLQDNNISRPVPSGVQRYKDKLKSRHAQDTYGI